MVAAARNSDISPATLARVQEALSTVGDMSTLLMKISNDKAIPEHVRDRLYEAMKPLADGTLAEAVESAADTLGIGSSGRVDFTRMKPSHEAVIGFIAWNGNVARGAEPKPTERFSQDDFKVIARFMQDHPKVEIIAHSDPNGRQMFEVFGEKAHRLAFQQDPRWPKLEEALKDVYHTESGAHKNQKPAISDRMKHVFG